jgi:hypothetical protein
MNTDPQPWSEPPKVCSPATQGLLSGMVGGSCGILPSWQPRRLQLGIVQPRLLTAGRVADPDPDRIGSG